MKTQTHKTRIIAGAILATLIMLTSAPAFAAEATNEIPLTTTTLSEGDELVKGNLLSQIREHLHLPQHLPNHSVYVHMYVNRDGKVKVLEVYSASSELKEWITTEIENKQFRILPSDTGRHFEFTVSFRTA